MFTLKATLWTAGDLLPHADVEDLWSLTHEHFPGTLQHTAWKQPLPAFPTSTFSLSQASLSDLPWLHDGQVFGGFLSAPS